MSINTIEGKSLNAYDGKAAWLRTPKGDIVDVEGPPVDMLRRENLPYKGETG